MAKNPLLDDFDSTSVAMDLVPITPNDSVDLATTARAIRCRPDGAAGTLRVTTWQGVVRNTYIEAGGVLGCAVSRVHSTGTTATNLEAML